MITLLSQALFRGRKRHIVSFNHTQVFNAPGVAFRRMRNVQAEHTTAGFRHIAFFGRREVVRKVTRDEFTRWSMTEEIIHGLLFAAGHGYRSGALKAVMCRLFYIRVGDAKT